MGKTFNSKTWRLAARAWCYKIHNKIKSLCHKKSPYLEPALNVQGLPVYVHSISNKKKNCDFSR
jgi:hypothetical protein